MTLSASRQRGRRFEPWALQNSARIGCVLPSGDRPGDHIERFSGQRNRSVTDAPTAAEPGPDGSRSVPRAAGRPLKVALRSSNPSD
jgi:hypothetical protein